MSASKDDAQKVLKSIDIQPGDRFRHYKGGEYEVVALALQEDSLQPVVVYRSLAKETLWVRTLSNWDEEVEVRGTRTKRFKKLV